MQPPIACSLSASELPARLAEMTDLGRAALLDADIQDRRAVLHFAPDAGVRERVEGIVAAESQCCAFLEMQIAEAPDEIVLSITAPDGAEPVLDELVSAFRDR
jgi:hypothetical protein